MPRPKKETLKSKEEINQDHYKKMVENHKSYSDYLQKEKNQKQLKLTLSLEIDSALREYCKRIDKTPQEHILSLIKNDLEKNGGISCENAADNGQ